jgi:hypothetical protein
MTAYTRKKAEEAKLVERELGKPDLKSRLKRLVKGDYNYANMEKRGAEYREQVKLAKELERRRNDGTRERNRKIRKKMNKSSSKPGANQK